jgi:flagellar secretion chaperone FliS
VQRAVRILEEGLRAGLDLKTGGTLARDLDDLYAYLGMRLTLANLRNDDAALAEVLRLIQPLAEAWKSIAPQVRR